ncbi:MAG: histidine--tRNA ligase [Nitriliruptorales bacterium]|nr:histidine--tRNA ligase [Nitriliruptorales bacterium]
MAIPEPVKGAPDWLPPDAAAFEAIERTFLDVAALAGYQRIRTPIFEHTEVFSRGVGASTDVVQKEMYTFADKGGRSLTLRPEGTAGVVRAALQAGVPRAGGLPVKYSYAGEYFRHERPQAGRQREFNQVGIEALGSDDPALDAEVVLLGWEALQRVGVRDLTLRMNSLGDREDRATYHDVLNAFLDDVENLPPDVQQRRHLNPLRAFDSKAPGMTAIMANAPLLIDHIGEEPREHHRTVVALLEGEGVPLSHDPSLVRGLDYYSRTTFEYQAGDLGAQNAVGGGGRYDGLAEDLGWSERFPGIGWALGVDRTLLAIKASGVDIPTTPRVDVFVAVADASLQSDAFALVTQLRRAGVASDLAFDGRSMKAQLKVADRSGARWTVIVGPDEAARGVVTVKDLDTGEQRESKRDEVAALLAAAATGREAAE